MENYWPTILLTKKHDHLCINGKLVCRLDSKSYFIGVGKKNNFHWWWKSSGILSWNKIMFDGLIIIVF